MKLLILAVAIALTQARSAPDNRDAQIVKYDFDNGGEGHYHYAYETSNGIAAQEDGELVKGQYSDYPSIQAKGVYKFTSPEGETVDISYTADENGFQPQGSHIPTPPPAPEYVARALAWIEAHPPPAIVSARI